MSNKITIDKELVRDITFDEYVGSKIEIIESGNWVDDGKYSFKDIIFKMNDKFYRLYVSRSGDYYSDYYYCWEDKDEFECYEVKSKEVTIIEWVNV